MDDGESMRQGSELEGYRPTPIVWKGNPDAKMLYRTQEVSIKLEADVELNMVPVYSYVQSGDKIKKKRTGWAELVKTGDRAVVTHKTVLGSCPSNMKCKACAMCGNRLSCERVVSADDCDHQTPIPKGIVVLNNVAVLFRKDHYEIGENERAVTKEAADIDQEGLNVNMKLKFLREYVTRSSKVSQMGLMGDSTGSIQVTAWRSALQPKMLVGRVYKIRGAKTDSFAGSFQIQLTDCTDVTELKNSDIRTKQEFAHSTSLGMLRDDDIIPEIALAVPGIDEKPPRFEDYSATPYLSETDYPDGGEIEMLGMDIDTSDSGFKLRKMLTTLYAQNPIKAKAVAKELTLKQWQSISKAGGLTGDLAFGLCKIWKEKEPEEYDVEAKTGPGSGLPIVTKKERQRIRSAAEIRKHEKFEDKIGLELRETIERLMAISKQEALAFTKTLCMGDWIAINKIGGLKNKV